MTGQSRVTETAVLSGKKIKWTLEQARGQYADVVRIDWLRFTVPLDAVLRPQFPPPVDPEQLAAVSRSERELVRDIRAVDASECVNSPVGAAIHGAAILRDLLGGVFVPDPECERGMDFYEVRCSLRYEGETVAHVLAGGKSHAQASTVHFNLHGKATLHVTPDTWARVYAWLSEVGGWITRVDLALDAFEGADVCAVRDEWLSGGFDVRGKRPSQREIGSWTSGHSRTFEVGQRQTGKVFRAYEKGDQLFGHEANDPWVRYEVEFRSTSRIIDLDVLTRPTDFFAGAYPFLETLAHRVQVDVKARKIPTFRKLLDKCEDAAVSRVVRWLSRTAGPALARVFWDGGEILAAIVEKQADRAPARLQGFARENIKRAFEKVEALMIPDATPLNYGT